MPRPLRRPSPEERLAWLLRLEPEGGIPVSTQLYRQVAVGIQNRALPAGLRLPSARVLARDLGLHYHTVNKVYLRLREEGLVVLDHRRRIHVRGPRAADASFVSSWTDRQRGLLTEAIAGGLRPTDLIARLRELVRSAAVAPASPSSR